MKQKKGFTLIELLAVIVILAIIALIAVPVILNILDKTNKSAFKDTAYGVLSAGELYFAEQQLGLNGMQTDKVFTLPSSELEIKGQVPAGTKLYVNTNGETALEMTNGRYCITKGYLDTDITISEGMENCVIPVRITELTLSETSVSIKKGETASINVMFEPSNVTNTALTWTTSNENIATVTNGVITGVAGGDAIITATTTDGSNISKTVSVIVSEEKTLSQLMVGTHVCTTNKTANACARGTMFTINVNDNETKNFYLIKDEGTKVTLIMTENLGDDVQWYADAADNSYGPITAINYLDGLTDEEWSNIPKRDYKYSGLAEDGTTRKYEDTTRNMRARLITYGEAWQELGCRTTGQRCPTYVYGGKTHWTSTVFSGNSNSAYRVSDSGYISWGTVTNYGHGIRPVIELSK